MINTIKFTLVYIKVCFLHFLAVSLEDQEPNSGGQCMTKLKPVKALLKDLLQSLPFSSICQLTHGASFLFQNSSNMLASDVKQWYL